jgi:hypothetical protein
MIIHFISFGWNAATFFELIVAFVAELFKVAFLCLFFG